MKKIFINPKNTLIVLLILAAIQCAAYLLVAYFKPESLHTESFWGLLDIDAEMSIQTWYSQSLFLVAALIMLWLSLISPLLKNKIYWGALSLILVYLSMDDGAMIHEKFWIINNALGIVSGVGLFHYSWTAVAIILVLVVCAVFAKFFFSLPVRTRWLFVLSGFVFLSGALGVEMYTSYIVDTTGYGVQPFVIALEETLEVAGVSILAYALLDHIRLLPKNDRSITLDVTG